MALERSSRRFLESSCLTSNGAAAYKDTISRSGRVVEKSVSTDTVMLGSLFVDLSYHFGNSYHVLDMASDRSIWGCF